MLGALLGLVRPFAIPKGKVEVEFSVLASLWELALYTYAY